MQRSKPAHRAAGPSQIEREAFVRREAARMLGISEGLVIKMGRLGKIKTIHIGRRRLVPRSEIERLLREGC